MPNFVFWKFSLLTHSELKIKRHGGGPEFLVVDITYAVFTEIFFGLFMLRGGR